MHTFFATTAKRAYMGSLQQCLNWANERLANKEAKIVKILKVRPDEQDVPIIAEVTEEGHFATPGGRTVKLSLLKKALKDGEKETHI